MAAVFFGIEKAFDTTWQPGLLYKLSKLEFSISFIKLINFFLSQRKFSVSVNGEMSTPKKNASRGAQASVLSPTMYNMYINNAPQNTWSLSEWLVKSVVRVSWSQLVSE
jgi:hypothetical protein